MIRIALAAAFVASAVTTPVAHAESALTSELHQIQTAALAQARSVFGRYLAAWSGANTTGEDIAAVFSDSAQIDLTLAGYPEWTIRIEGRPAIGEFLDAMNAVGSRWSFSDLHFFPTLQAGTVFVQYSASATSPQTGEVQYRNLVLVEVDADRIVRIRDFNGAPLVMRKLNDSTQIAAQPTATKPIP